jgi:hypothetical protein
MNQRTKQIILITLAASFLGCGRADAQVNNRVTTTVAVDVPSVVKLTAADNITTVQNLKLDSSNITFDFNLGARGTSFVTWRGNSNSNGGFRVTLQRSVITGTAPESLRDDVIVIGEPFAGGDTNVTIASPYVAGLAISKVSESVPDLFCTSTKPGSAQFNVRIVLDAPSAHGTGTVNTTLTFVAATL